MMAMSPRISRCGVGSPIRHSGLDPSIGHSRLDPQSMDPRVRAALLAAICACCAWMAGCAQMGGPVRADDAPGVLRAGGVSAQAAQASVVIGKSTKADVMAALGQATAIPFDSGFEVWVYRWRGAQKTNRAATELVILFEPSGVVKKTRVRPGYGPDEPKPRNIS